MSIYIVGGRPVYVILNILLIFLEIVRLLCVLVRYRHKMYRPVASLLQHTARMKVTCR